MNNDTVYQQETTAVFLLWFYVVLDMLLFHSDIDLCANKVKVKTLCSPTMSLNTFVSVIVLFRV